MNASDYFSGCYPVESLEQLQKLMRILESQKLEHFSITLNAQRFFVHTRAYTVKMSFKMHPDDISDVTLREETDDWTQGLNDVLREYVSQYALERTFG